MERSHLSPILDEISVAKLPDPEITEDFLYVEDLPIEHPLTADLAESVLDAFAEEFGNLDSIKVRAAPEHQVSTDFNAELRLVAMAESSQYYQDLTTDVEIDDARTDDTSFVEDCYREALRRGYTTQIDSTQFEDEVNRVINDPTRLSLIARREGNPIGHITLIPSAFEDADGNPATELSDVFVIPGQPMSIINDLTKMGLKNRPVESQKVFATVVHADPEKASAITAGLQSKGWHHIYTIWKYQRQKA